MGLLTGKGSDQRIDYSKKFLKQYRRAPIAIQDQVAERLEVFSKDKFDSILNNHALSGNLRGYRSINITGDWRILYREAGGIVIFELLGTHSQLYK